MTRQVAPWFLLALLSVCPAWSELSGEEFQIPPGPPERRQTPQEIAARRAVPRKASPFYEVRISPDDGHTQNETSIAVDGSTLVAGWNNFTDESLVMGVARSGDRGETWDSQLLDGDALMTDPTVAAGGGGVWYFGYLATQSTTDAEEFRRTAEVYVRRSVDDGRSWEPPVKVTEDAAFDDKPYIAARGQEVLVIWYSAAGGGVRTARSVDGARTFEHQTDFGENGIGAPVIAPDGTYHLFWTIFVDADGPGAHLQIRATRSGDRGKTWKAPVTIAELTFVGPGFRAFPYPAAAADPTTGNLLVAWPQAGPFGPRGFADAGDVAVIRSEDGGRTWTAPVLIDDDGTDTFQGMPWLTFDERGVAHAVFYDGRYAPAGRDLLDVTYARSADGGATWQSRRVTGESFSVLDAWEGLGSLGFIGDYLGIAASDGRAYLCYQDGREGNEDIFVARVEDPEHCAQCLGEGRFRVSVSYRTKNGQEGEGKPVAFSDVSVLFWFFNETNIELIVKILDGSRVNGNFWVFYGALSDVEYDIRVEDLTTGAVRTYHNPQGEICGRGDTGAFPATSAAGRPAADEEAGLLAPVGGEACWRALPGEDGVLVPSPAAGFYPGKPESWIESRAVRMRSGEVTAGAARDRAAATDRVLVRYPGPVTTKQLAVLEAAAQRVYTYLPDHAFLVRMGPDKSASELQASWIGPYLPSYKVAPEVDTKRVGAERRVGLVHIFPDADLGEVRRHLEARGAEVLGAGGAGRFQRLRFACAGPDFGRLAREAASLDDVFWVDAEGRRRLANERTVPLAQSGPEGGGATPVFDHGVKGRDEVVAVLDTGADADHCGFRGLYPVPRLNVCDGGTAVNLFSKVAAVDFLDARECEGGIGKYEWDTLGHGTHVAGTVAAHAPDARLVIQDGGYRPDECSEIPALGCPVVDLKPIFQQAYDQGARVHNNSWGDREEAPDQGLYTMASQDADRFVWEHPDFLPVFAAGNSGNEPGTVWSPSTAKNVLSVGAGASADFAERMAPFSSCGPTGDGRIKPDLTLPGAFISSLASDGDVTTHNCGKTIYSGTSMSAPAVAGSAALVRQYFKEGFYADGEVHEQQRYEPSAALVKAMLVHSARSMTEADGPAPSSCQGWGRVQLDRVLDFADGKRRLLFRDQERFERGGSGGKKDFYVKAGGGEPFKATLVWTDYPSTPAAAVHLVNDLDLEVVSADGTVYRGNVFADDGSSQAGRERDRRNTVEQVVLPSAPPGVYTVRVRAWNVPEGPQTYALVVTGDLAEVEPPLFARFHQAPLDPEAGDEVVFSDRSLGEPDSWCWRFGDDAVAGGETCSEVTPDVRRALPAGRVPVSLTVRRGGESSTVSSEIEVGKQCDACLLDSRFVVGVEWYDRRGGQRGVGVPIRLSDQTLVFWFFQQTNAELIVKLLDAREVNGRFWVFFGGLSDVEYTVTVLDQETGKTRRYQKEQGEVCGRADTAAF